MDEKILKIIAAIRGLNPETDYTRGGSPKVEAIEDALGFDITAGERDQAWALITAGEEAGEDETAETKPAFDKSRASCVVTMRNSKPCRVWFRDGKEIGAEDA